MLPGGTDREHCHEIGQVNTKDTEKKVVVTMYSI